jgi:hypothetical protein
VPYSVGLCVGWLNNMNNNLKLIRDELLPSCDTHDKTYLISVIDTPDKRLTKTLSVRKFLSTGVVYESKHTQTEQKFLCVNGPLAGQKVTEDDAKKVANYITYNCSVSIRDNKKTPRTVQIVFDI